MGPEGVEQFVSTPELHSDEAIESDPLPPGQVWAASMGTRETGPGLFRIEVNSGPGAGVKILNQPAAPAFRESVKIGEQNLYARSKEVVGDRDPREHEFSIQMRAIDSDLPRNACAEPVEVLLRRQLSRFLVERSPWKVPFHEMIDIFIGKEWKAVLFGGVPRDLILYGPSKRPRDVDIVVDCSLRELSSILASYPVQRTRFGGFRITSGKWSFDIWSLPDTWAFASGYMDATFDNLHRTTFFNVEAIAAQFNTRPGGRRSLYSFGFSDAISSGILVRRILISS
jgi:hypothetical protein